MSAEERAEPLARIVTLSPRVLELAKENPQDPIARDALVQVIVVELWLEENTPFPGRGHDRLDTQALALLTRDHVQSDRLGDVFRRLSYGFGKEYELFFRTVLARSPHRDMRGLALFRLGNCLKGRMQKLDLIE